MEKKTVIKNGEVFLNGRFEKKDLQIENGVFTEISDSIISTEYLDASGKYILPGLVDIHTHGRVGLDFTTVTEEQIEKLLRSYYACGVTSVAATIMTNKPAVMEEAARLLGTYIARQKAGEGNARACARLIGIHMEGPFLGKEKRGAHDEQYLQPPDREWLERLQMLSGGAVRMVTLDPVQEGAEDFIRYCKQSGVRVSLGHTDCDYETAVAAGTFGADHVTHIFNAMNPLHHREPGLIGAAMDTGMYLELICDGIHVHPAVVRMLFAAHPEKVVLISDSILVAGMQQGKYISGGMQVTLQNGRAFLSDGTIAGSAISLFDSMVMAIRCGVLPEQAVCSATCVAADSIGLKDAGSIAIGKRAELLMVDKAWNLEKVLT